jgi:hypothetical protein
MLANQLIEAIFRYYAVSVCACVHSVIGARGVAIEGDAEADGLSIRARTQNKVKVARVKAKRDTGPCVQRGCDLVLVLPFAGQGPLVKVQYGWGSIELRIILIESPR